MEKVLKALYVRKLFLWPRFHSAVREVLEAESLAAEVSSVAVSVPGMPGHDLAAATCTALPLGIALPSDTFLRLM